AQERAAQGEQEKSSVLDGVPSGLPALMKAAALQKKAAKVGFDWDHPSAIVEKVMEELREFQAELDAESGTPGREGRLLDEMGDLLFAAVNLARYLRLDPEEALSAANRKFAQRFRYI